MAAMMIVKAQQQPVFDGKEAAQVRGSDREFGVWVGQIFGQCELPQSGSGAAQPVERLCVSRRKDKRSGRNKKKSSNVFAPPLQRGSPTWLIMDRNGSPPVGRNESKMAPGVLGSTCGTRTEEEEHAGVAQRSQTSPR
ncbi:hypothetical protein ZHAS_00020334 [Anopheles sinensis]|uniref:Uncharacterized protein n=1 Tax=Anopheles sinensis TaxID=74873 RepID=A0A084WPS9_ANOSI|nr:hypothetical protein ZHAS_00020334 [Anopheles sinensis]